MYSGSPDGQSIIPSMGIPASDNLLTASLKTTNYFIPEIPIDI
jgi:hypothetical protein